MIRFFKIAIVCVAVAMVSCTAEDEKPEAQVVEIPETKTSSLLEGSTKQFELVHGNKGVTWSSDDPAIATVDDQGFVTGVALGEVSIKAIAEGGTVQEWVVDVGIRPEPTSEFIMTWDAKKIQIPVKFGLEYSYNVDWDNDGIMDETGITESVWHTFETEGKHTIRISGNYPAVYFPGIWVGYRDKLISIDQWGTTKWQDMEGAFEFCENVQILATDVPDLSEVTSMERMFRGALKANPDVSSWDVSNVTNMSHMFENAISAAPDLSNWDVSNVTDMSSMFEFVRSVNADVSKWDVSNVTNMDSMFYHMQNWNPDVSNWDVSNVTSMSNMFGATRVFYATIADPDVSNWDVSNVTNMSGMFSGAIKANPDVSNWDVSSVISTTSMFSGAESANPDVSNWDVSNVNRMSHMFRDTKIANPNVSKWNVSNVTNMAFMFYNTEMANPDVSNWNVSRVSAMNRMFQDALLANPDVSKWNVSNVYSMDKMFSRAASANPDVSNWNVPRLQRMYLMFEGKTSFSKANYEKLLINFANQSRPEFILFDRVGLEATSPEALAAKQVLIEESNWRFIDNDNL